MQKLKVLIQNQTDLKDFKKRKQKKNPKSTINSIWHLLSKTFSFVNTIMYVVSKRFYFFAFWLAVTREMYENNNVTMTIGMCL